MLQPSPHSPNGAPVPPDLSGEPLLREAALRLDAWFDACPRVAVAFSGGVDSALVAFWARRRLGRARAIAWIADTPSLKRSDLELARSFCRAHDIELRELATQEIDNEDYARNAFDRCYHCKTTLYTTLTQALQGRTDGDLVCSGANLDDLGDYRPGLTAAKEQAIRHPLVECSVGKALVRRLAHAMNLEVWDKPASPCLSSRLPYGERVTREKLARIEAAELWLSQEGFTVCRVRSPEGRAVIEVPPAQLAKARDLLERARLHFATLGFEATELDPEGFVSGKMNRVLPNLRQPSSPPSAPSKAALQAKAQ